MSNQLSALLDQQHNETAISDLDLYGCPPPDTIFSKCFWGWREIYTSRSEKTQEPLPSIKYRVIGFGQCGLVFEVPGQGYVLKVAKGSYEEALWDDFKAHLRVHEAFSSLRDKSKAIYCRVPRPFSYIPKNNKVWWKRNLSFLPTVHESITLPAMTLVSERILPLPKVAREALIRKYCAAEHRELVAANPTNRDCLARIYLGRRRVKTTPPPNFTLRNFNLHLDQMIELGFPTHDLAIAIGDALAVIHWLANVDAYDIEFVLGSDADNKYSQDVLSALKVSSDKVTTMPPHTDIEGLLNTFSMRRKTRLWVLDFNLCHIWDETAAINHPETLITHLVEAFFENDPYYPLPLMEDALEESLWKIFSDNYIKKAGEVLRGKDRRLACLPQKFIDGCIQREMRSLLKGLGHGHREMKQ